METKLSIRDKRAGAIVHDAGNAVESADTPEIGHRDGDASSNIAPKPKQKGIWVSHATRLVDEMNKSPLVPTQVLTSLDGHPDFFTCKGVGVYVKKSDELLTVVFSDGSKLKII